MASETNKYKAGWSGGKQCQKILYTVFGKPGSVKCVEVKIQSECS